MKSEHSIFQDVRDREIRALSALIDAKASFIHVLGSPGCGKTTLVREAVKNENCAFIDSNLCSSSRGLMSSILLALVNLRPSKSIDSDSSDSSDTEMKDEKAVVGAMPGVSSLVDQTTLPGKRQRLAAVAANERIAATGLLNRKRSRRIEDNAFIDDSDDEETRGDQSNSSLVEVSVHRLIRRAQMYRVKTESAFIQKLEIVLLRLQKRGVEFPYLVLDDIEGISENFLTLLSKLPEFSIFDLKIILVSSQLLSSSAVVVPIPPFSKSECIAILTASGDSRFAAFVTVAMGFLYPSFCGNFVLLRNTILSIYNPTQFADPKMVTIQTKKLVVARMQKIFGAPDGSFEEEASSLVRVQTEVRWLSAKAKQVLIAGFLASHNPVNHDKTLFKLGGNNSKKNRTTTTAFKKARLAADCIQIRAPVAFHIGRLEKIVAFFNSYNPSEDSILKEIRELVHFGLFKSSATSDWLRTEVRISCHAPMDLINLVAKQINVRLDEVLFA